MAELKKSHRHDDIIHKPHPVSSRHAAMTNRDRAAQFSPFAALTGYEEVIVEASRQTSPRIELEESEQQILDRKLQYLYDHIREQPEVEITYFEPDTLKDGGAYLTVKGHLKKIDVYNKRLVFTTGKKIPIREIIHIFFADDGFEDVKCSNVLGTQNRKDASGGSYSHIYATVFFG